MRALQRQPLTKSERTRRKEKTVSFIILFIASALWVFPLVYMFGTSFKSEMDLQLHPESIFPTSWDQWTLEHYTGFIIREGKIDNMPLWMLNSLWSTLASVALTVLLDLITAYAVVFFDFKGRKLFVKFLMLWMVVPGILGTAPSFALYAAIRNAADIQNQVLSYFYTYFWIIVPGCTGIFNFLLMRSFFASIPKDIIDSARSDGASNFTIFKRVVCPLAKSTIMIIVLFTFTGSWNNLAWPQLLLSGEISYWNTITVALTGYAGGSGWSMMGVTMATSVFALIPIIIIFVITQNKMIDGLATSGIKG